jgi:hypothetical protein
VLPGGDGSPHVPGPEARERGIEVDHVPRIREAGVEVGGDACEAVRVSDLSEFWLAPPHEDRLGDEPIAVRQEHAAFLADGEDRANQVLVQPHAPGDAIHDHAD